MGTAIKVIFLDIDGVLVSHNSLKQHRPLLSKADPACVDVLNALIKWTGAQIVISSSWRYETAIQEFRDLLFFLGSLWHGDRYDSRIERKIWIRLSCTVTRNRNGCGSFAFESSSHESSSQLQAEPPVVYWQARRQRRLPS
jgi:hypothetical protein